MPVVAGVEAPINVMMRRQRPWGTLVASVPQGISRIEGDSPSDRWMWGNGATLTSEACGHVQVDPIGCSNLTRTELDNWGAQVEFQPIFVWAARECSILSGPAMIAELPAAARRRVAEDITYQLASELYLGTTTSNPAITVDPTVITVAAALPAHQAVELLDEYVALLHGNLQATLHVTPAMLTSLGHSDVVSRVGDAWYTPTGHLVIGDAGYTGAIPTGDNVVDENGDPVTPDALADGEEYIYATSDVAWDFGPEEAFSADSGTSSARHNRTTALAQRPALAVFDPTCIHLAVLATLC